MKEIVTKQITLEDAYCKAHNYVATLSEDSLKADRHITALLNTIDFIESTLAKKYMEEKGYFCDNSAGVDVWQKLGGCNGKER